jgi:hypothetical protein
MSNIGQLYNVSSTRIGQIKDKALRKFLLNYQRLRISRKRFTLTLTNNGLTFTSQYKNWVNYKYFNFNANDPVYEIIEKVLPDIKEFVNSNLTAFGGELNR